MTATHTCVEVSLRQRHEDGVHGAHVKDEAQLRHTHGDEAQQEDGTEDALHEGLSCRGNERKEIRSVCLIIDEATSVLFTFHRTKIRKHENL